MEDGDPLFITMYLLFVLVLVFLNSFFVAAEFAMVRARALRIDQLAMEGQVRARYAQRILQNLNAYLSACQLGITFASLALGWIGGSAVARLLHPALSAFLPEYVIQTLSFIIAFAIITTFHITLGELVPKTYAIRYSEKIILRCAIPVTIFYTIMYPFIWIFNGLSSWILRRVGVEPEAEHDTVHTDEEIRVIMQESHKSGFLDQTEMAFMDNIFDFSETHAREIMIPRTEMICLYANLPYEETKKMIIEEMHTRFPVCDPDKDNIIGFVHIKDIMKSGDSLKDIRDITRPIMIVPEAIPISSLLKQMQKKRTEMALVIDEYGGTSGIVTMEDILEEIVGELHDEFDEAAPAIEERDAETHSVDGLLLIDEFNEFFGTNISNEEFDTIGGWVYAQVEMPPKKDQSVRFDTFELIIEEVDHMRISRLTVRKHAEEEEEDLESVS